MQQLLKRDGGFDYSAFTKEIIKNVKIGEVVVPGCVRYSRKFGNTDPHDTAHLRIKQAFDLNLGSIPSNGFKRKRCKTGGYEYLKIAEPK